MSERSFAEIVDEAGAVEAHGVQRLAPVGTRPRAGVLNHMTHGHAALEAATNHSLFYPIGGSNDVIWFAGRRVMGAGSRPRSISLLHAHKPSGWEMPEPTEVLHVYLDDLRLRWLAETQIGIDPARLSFGHVWAEDDDVIQSLAGQILTEIDAPDPLSPLLLDQVEVALAARLLRQYSNVAAIPVDDDARQVAIRGDRRIKRVCDFIEAHLDEHLGIDDLAAIACLSSFHFIRAFRDATGRTPHRHVVHRRVRRAMHLLSTDMPLAQVAFSCGFASHAHLSTTFKAQSGVSPSAWRRLQ